MSPLILIAALLLPMAANADALPLTLKLWSVKQTHTLTCTGKFWTEVPAGMMHREAVIAVLPGTEPLSNEQKLLACDDGTGKDAPITGDVSEVRTLQAGQTVLQGTLRVIALRYPAPQNTISTILFAVNTALGDMALDSKSGKGLIHLDHASGITVYPPSYHLDRVIERPIYTVQEPPKAASPCTITYLADDPEAAPRKVIRTRLDCGDIIQQTSSDGIFAGNIPQQF